MKAKRILTLSLLAVASVAIGFLSACVGTPQQQAATGVYAIGEAVAAKLISKGIDPAVVTDIAQKLALVPGGTLTPAQYGQLSGEIQNVREALSLVQASKTVSASSSDYAAIDAYLSGVATGNAAANAGRAPTLAEGNVLTVVTQFTNGVQDGVTFTVSRNAALNPRPVTDLPVIPPGK